MRLLESLLLLADLLTLIVLSVPRAGSARWLRQLPTAALFMAAVQMFVEGVRWQMLPAYLLTGMFFLVSELGRDLVTNESANRRWPVRTAVGPGIVGLAIAGALPIIIPVFQFPHPTGPHAIGTLTYHWEDTSRGDIFAANPNAPRELMVQVWYPANIDSTSTPAPYMQQADAVMAAFARIHDKPRFLFSHFRHVTTNAVASARMVDGQASYPVLIFLEGVTGFRQMNTFQLEELASHGYIVIAIDQPGIAANVVFPDGREVMGLPVLQSQALVRPSHMPGETAPLLHGRALEAKSIVPFLAQDVAFTLDRMAMLNQADPNKVLTGRLDLQRTGIFGVSLGGIVAGVVCLQEPRVRACMMMDAPMASDVAAARLAKPSMWITRDAASMRLERQRSGGWSEADINAHQSSMRAVYESVTAEGYFVRIPGTFHSNFTDIPDWTPLASRLNLTGPIDGQRAHEIINAYSLAFFDRHLAGRDAKLLDGPSDKYPKVLFESRPP